MTEVAHIERMSLPLFTVQQQVEHRMGKLSMVGPRPDHPAVQPLQHLRVWTGGSGRRWRERAARIHLMVRCASRRPASHARWLLACAQLPLLLSCDTIMAASMSELQTMPMCCMPGRFFATDCIPGSCQMFTSKITLS